jgi:hypothetical protein
MSRTPNTNQTAGAHTHHMGSAPFTNLGSLAATMIASVHMHMWIYKAQGGSFGKWETRREGSRGREGSQEEEDDKGPPMKEEGGEGEGEEEEAAAKDKSDVQQEVYGYSNE